MIVVSIFQSSKGQIFDIPEGTWGTSPWLEILLCGWSMTIGFSIWKPSRYSTYKQTTHKHINICFLVHVCKANYLSDLSIISNAEAYLCLRMPREVEAVGLTGHRQGEGESVIIHHIVSYIVQLCVQACVRTEDRKLYHMRKCWWPI